MIRAFIVCALVLPLMGCAVGYHQGSWFAQFRPFREQALDFHLVEKDKKVDIQTSSRTDAEGIRAAGGATKDILEFVYQKGLEKGAAGAVIPAP